MWTDPRTGEAFLVDSRTGHCSTQVNQFSGVHGIPELLQGQRRRTLVASDIHTRMPDWIHEALGVRSFPVKFPVNCIAQTK
jgi:hypothetical protein